jgi:hypothetical protein
MLDRWAVPNDACGGITLKQSVEMGRDSIVQENPVLRDGRERAVNILHTGSRVNRDHGLGMNCQWRVCDE